MEPDIILYRADLLDNGPMVVTLDIGGTNSNIGVLTRVHDAWVLVARGRLPSQNIRDMHGTVAQIIAYIKSHYDIVPEGLCLGVAGIVSADQEWVKPTNLSIVITKHDIQQATGIAHIALTNDFLLVAYGVDALKGQQVRRYDPRNGIPSKGQRAFIGAGTGLGTAYARWDNRTQTYAALNSEGGHTCAAGGANEQAQQLYTLLKKDHPYLSYEDILSGQGMARIYQALGSLGAYGVTPMSREITQAGFRPDLITRYAQDDPQCAMTWKWYAYWYGLYAQTVALQGLARGGLYIAGGIAAHNPHLIEHPAFKEAFLCHPRHGDFLAQVPLVLVVDYDVSLYGGALYLDLVAKGII